MALLTFFVKKKMMAISMISQVLFINFMNYIYTLHKSKGVGVLRMGLRMGLRGVTDGSTVGAVNRAESAWAAGVVLGWGKEPRDG